MKLLERLKCPFCENTKFKTLYKEFYNSSNMRNFLMNYYKNREILNILESEIYEINECIICKGIFQKFIPDDDLSYYIYEKLISVTESFSKKKNIFITNYKEYYLDAEIIEKLIKKRKNEIKILEFGSGWGFWAKFMKKLNFNVETVEISSSRIDYLKKEKIKNYRNLNEINNNYDLIFSNQALEHISNPLQTIKILNSKLNESGIMFHKFPSSIFFKIKLKNKYKPKKDCAHPLEHINIYNKRCFNKICEINNLKKIKINNLNFINKIKILKNDFKFSQIILKK